MAYEMKLPELGEGVTEGEIVKWLVREGDMVAEDQPVVEIMTDKATVEIPVLRGGKIAKLLAAEGEVVSVGNALALIEEGSPAARPSPAPEAPAPARPEKKKEAIPPAPASGPERPVLASPSTRKLAREMGRDLRTIAGSGPGGRVTREDLLGASPAEPGQEEGSREERIPLRGIRKKIAEQMSRSWAAAAHFTHVDECDMTDIVELRAKAKPSLEAKGIKLTYLPFVIKALCSGLKEFPRLNAVLDEEKNEIVLKRYYNIGLAVATRENDLVVPVLKDADRKSIVELAGEIQALAEKARAGKLELEDLKGGTFTLTSTGNIGGLLATPILNYPEVGILAIQKIRPRPAVREERIVIRQVCNLSLSLDHRVVDGAMGASFLNHVIGYLENFDLLSLDA